MRVLALPLMLAAALSAPLPAHADLLVGMVTENGIKGVNIEKSGQMGSLYLIAGSYQSNTGFELENLTAVIGFRRYQEGKYDQDAYFGGAFVGDVDGGPGYNRYGVGGELGYQWVTEHLRFTLQGGVALAGESSKGPTPGSTDIEPVPLLGASVSLRF